MDQRQRHSGVLLDKGCEQLGDSLVEEGVGRRATQHGGAARDPMGYGAERAERAGSVREWRAPG